MAQNRERENGYSNQSIQSGMSGANQTLEGWLREVSRRYGVAYKLQLGGFIHGGMRFFLTPDTEPIADAPIPPTIVVNLRGNEVEIEDA